jgi:pimeloyl-ACP methyl ester carboxylesterase
MKTTTHGTHVLQPTAMRLCCAVAALSLANAVGPTADRAEASMVPDPTNRTFPIGTKLLDYCGNGSLTARASGIRRVVLVVHGSSANHCDYARYALESAQDAGALASTLVVAPLFTDAATNGDQRLTWGSGWREGSTSSNPDGTKVSSFAAMDLLAAAARQTFGVGVPLLLVGHSAGGQFVQRYAEGSDAPFDTFVPMNPSSYAYLSAQRWRGETRVDAVSGCPGYNTWKYGLDGLNRYMADAGDLRRRYAAHRVAILLGGSDVERDDALDVGGEADAQGRHRLERGQLFFGHLAEQLGSRPPGHTLSVVPAVGHDGRSMIRSAQARAILFR